MAITSLNRTQISPPFAPVLPTGPTGPASAAGFSPLRIGGTSLGVLPEPGTVRQRGPEQFGVTTPTTGLPGSSLDTLYGINAGTYLTADQRKLAQQIQGKFDASMDSRDRALAQYGAPRLSSYAEDEALARAMSLAQGLNYRPTGPTGPAGGVRTQTGALPKGGVPYVPPTVPPPGAPSNTGAQNAASWQRILTGLVSIAPLLFGRDAYGQFINKGLFPSIKEAYAKAVGDPAAASMTDQELHNLIDSQGAYPTAAAANYWGQQATVEGGYPTIDVNPGGAVTTPLVTGPPIEGSPWLPDTAFGSGGGWDFGSLGGA